MNPNDAAPDPRQVDSDDQPTSWFSQLIDVRVVVFLVCVVVAAMTATVLILSDDRNLPDSKDLSQVKTPANVDDASEKSGSVTAESESQQIGESLGENKTESPLVLQRLDAKFEFSLSDATLRGCMLRGAGTMRGAGISDWQQDGEAVWRMKIDQRRSGFYYCHVTYRAAAKCQFAVQTGENKLRRFTVYPTEEDFEEKFIVRLDKPDEQAMKLIASQIEPNARVAIKKIELIPQK